MTLAVPGTTVTLPGAAPVDAETVYETATVVSTEIVSSIQTVTLTETVTITETVPATTETIGAEVPAAP